jgi:H+/Cl- antiporter ClcA
LLLLAAVVGLVVSLAAWSFLELVHQIQVGVFDKLPGEFGYDHGAPLWWSLPILAVAGVLVAVAIVLLPGRGGHVPAHGLKTGVTQPVELPGVMLAAVATIGLGLVLGPEAPSSRWAAAWECCSSAWPEEMRQWRCAVMAAPGTFAALAMIFE